MLPILGLAAELTPDAPSTLISRLPRCRAFDTMFGLQLAGSWHQASTGQPDVGTLHASNNAVLASIFDDNASPVAILRVGLGPPAGETVAPKQFPIPFDAPWTLGVFGGSRHVTPVRYGSDEPLYRWRDWQQIGAEEPLLAPDGRPYTKPENEVTDVGQFARAVAGDGLDFFQLYFHARILSDLVAFQFGDRSGTLAAARYNVGTANKPVLNLDAARGVAVLVATPDPPPARPRLSLMASPTSTWELPRLSTRKACPRDCRVSSRDSRWMS